MDVSKYEYLVHYNGNWYELKRRLPRPGRRQSIYIWQGTWSGAGYKRITRKAPRHTCETSLVSISGSGLRCRICDRPILP